MSELLTSPDREIDARGSDGIDVRWMLRPDGSQYVTAEDRKLNTFNVLEVPEGKGKDVFGHPYSYLADIALAETCPDFIPETA